MSETDKRRAALAKIHLGAKQLGLDDDTYRDMLWTVARVRSAKDLDAFGRERVLQYLRRCGASFHRTRRPTPEAGKAPLIRKVYAMLGERPVEYAEGILQRMCGADQAPARLEWATGEQLRKVVAALMYDRRRHPNAHTTGK